jgi:uncharacterized protein (DUF2252 family)
MSPAGLTQLARMEAKRTSVALVQQFSALSPQVLQEYFCTKTTEESLVSRVRFESEGRQGGCCKIGGSGTPAAL